MTAARIGGECDPAFGPVRSAFAANFAERGELGASVAVRIGGRTVVDLWGGSADTGGRPWERDTIVDVFSVGKAMVALSLLLLIGDGRLDFDDTVSRTWPEFAQRGKDHVTVAQLMSHQAGVPGVRARLELRDLYDWSSMTSALASEPPWWEPGSAVGYHVNTLGFLGGEIVRRVSGQPFAAYFQNRLSGPLGADFHFGVNRSDQHRVADYQFPAGPIDSADHDAPLSPIYHNPPGASGVGTVNSEQWRAAVHPSTNGHANARAIAALYDVLARDDRSGPVQLSAAVLQRATSTHADGHDVVLDRPSRFGFGFQLPSPERPLGPGINCFGHFGAGGSVGLADRDVGLAFGYCMNRFGLRWRDPRNQTLLTALYSCL